MASLRITLTFPSDVANNPVTLHLIRNFVLEINILKAEITPGQKGYLLLDLKGESDEIERAVNFLKNERVECIPLNKQIVYDEKLCVHCGACTAVCFSGALTLKEEEGSLIVEKEKCIACGLCVNACPLAALKISFAE